MPPSPRIHTLSDFDFELPELLIAQHPAPERSSSRLLDGRQSPPTDRIFRELPGLLQPGDLVVFNDTKVVKARVFGEKASGGQLELLIERVLTGNEVVAHMKVSKKPLPGATIHMAGGRRAGGFDATLLARWPDENGPLFHFALHGPAGESAWELMERHGHLPLPPYIERQQNAAHDPDAAEDAERYQTVFARAPGAVAAPTAALHFDAAEDSERYQTVFAARPGAVAAPTAALHFDDAVLARLAERGIERASVTLHVGAGTFQPVKTENLADHQMHSEWYEIPLATLAALERCRQRGGRVVAVGTTTVRTLESWAQTGQFSGDTRIFITPGFEYQVVDLLITNFHLPKSTLMMLVSAFAGYEQVMALYRHAIAQEYRFFSYGDSMLLKKKSTP